MAEETKQKLKIAGADTQMQGKQEKMPVKGTDGRKMAIILIRGLVKVNSDIKDALGSLGLLQKHVCVIRPMDKNYLGMVKKAKDYIAWGEISSDTYKKLLEKRSQKDSEGKMKPYFRLHPPRGGFERKGIKKSFTQGGALGYRGEKINSLIEKML